MLGRRSDHIVKFGLKPASPCSNSVRLEKTTGLFTTFSVSAKSSFFQHFIFGRGFTAKTGKKKKERWGIS